MASSERISKCFNKNDTLDVFWQQQQQEWVTHLIRPENNGNQEPNFPHDQKQKLWKQTSINSRKNE